MSLILVVEPTEHHGEPVHQALAAEGYTVKVVGSGDEALRVAASQAPSVVMISAALPAASATMDAFASKRGGPGVVALVDRSEQLVSFEAHADFVLVAPITEQDYRTVVERSLSGSRSAAGHAQYAGDNPKLSSQEIFGELLVEVESDGAAAAKKASSAEIFGEVLAELGEPPAGQAPAAKPADRPAAAPQSPPPAARPPAASSPTAKASAAKPRAAKPSTTEPFDLDAMMRAASGSKAAKPAAAKPARRPPLDDDDEIQRKLERTLSGFLAPQKPAPSKAKPAGGDNTSSDIDALLSRTLSSLELGSRPKPKRSAPNPEAASADAAISEGATSESAASEDQAKQEPAASAPAAPHSEEESFAGLVAESAAPSPAASPTAYRPVAVGQEFGQYTLLERIAVGGMAEVWKARMKGVEGFQKTVAIKKILNHLTDNESFVTMFIDEAKLAAQLSHPNITHIYDLGKLGDDYYIAMEFIEGRNLRALLTAAKQGKARMPTGLALLIGARLASALDYAHRKRGFDDRELGLVHRDVSPQNVLISHEGDIKLCDFGIVKAVSRAQHTQMGALKGKLQYMSPEQAWGRKVDHRSDLFSLGSLLFEMTTGRRLFPGDNEFSVLEAVRECEVPDVRELAPEISAATAELIGRALQKDPDQRFQSAGEMQQQIEALLYAQSPTPSQADLAAFVHRVVQGAALAPASGAAEPTPSALRKSDIQPVARAQEAATEAPRAAQPPAAETIQLAALVDELSPQRNLEQPPAAMPPSETQLPDSGVRAAPQDGEAVAPAQTVTPPKPAPETTGQPAAASHAPETRPPGGAAGSDAKTAEAALETSRVVEVVLPAAGAEPEKIDSGKRGRWWIVLLLLVIAAALAVVGWTILRGRSAQPAVAPPALSEPAAAEQSPDPASPGEEGSGVMAPGAGDAGAADTGLDVQAADAQPEVAAPAALGEIEVERLVDEELARREAALRADFEAKQRELEKQLETVRETRQQQKAADPPTEADPKAADDPPPSPPSSRPPASLVKLSTGEYSASGSAPGPPPLSGSPDHPSLSKTRPSRAYYC
jgi:serine/threonine protein kinase/CheY-like chemotaxis protein